MAYLQLNSCINLVGEGDFGLWPFVRDGSVPFCDFRPRFEKDHPSQWGFQGSVCSWGCWWAAAVTCSVCYSQLHGPGSLASRAHQCLLTGSSFPWLLSGQGSGEKKQKKKCFAFHFVPLPCLFCKGLWQSASRDVQCLAWCRLSLQVASCHGNRSPNNANIWNAERNCGIWAVWKIANL